MCIEFDFDAKLNNMFMIMILVITFNVLQGFNNASLLLRVKV